MPWWTRTPLIFLLPTAALSLSFSKIPNYLTGAIACDERVIFFPTVGYRINGTHWCLPVRGWIFEPELDSRKRKVAIDGLGRILGFDEKDFEMKLLRRRLMPFAADNQSLKYVNVRGIGKGVRPLPRSKKDGHFAGRVIARDDELRPDDDGVIQYEANASGNGRDGRRFAGSIHLLEPTGTSIISDIDDTVKITNHRDGGEFLKNTFLREFREVPGMADLYRLCRSRRDGFALHFVSASPYQLFEELRDFLEGATGFPRATYHLKRIRVKDKSLLRLFEDPTEYKLRQIGPLLGRFPKRRFVLVGDSGEKDPEVYAELYRRYPERIEAIWIRDVGGRAGEERMDGVPPDRWRYFRDGFDLMDQLGWAER